MKKLLYLFYYAKTTPGSKLNLFLEHAQKESGKSKISILTNMIISSYQYNVSFLDYFYFRFYNLDKSQRKEWAGTGFMYEYQLKMNPEESRNILEDKIQFLQKYDEFVERKWVQLKDFSNKHDLVSMILKNPSGKIVVKNSKGQVGKEVSVLEADCYSVDSLFQFMKDNHYDLLEEAVIQHSALMNLSPSGLNTVRIITQLKNSGKEVVILGARLRVSVDSPVDNMGAGNFAIALDSEKGVAISDGIYSDIMKSDEKTHPITDTKIRGFQVPHWDLIIDFVKKAALKHPQNQSIGWDVAIKESSVELIEGNHNWCKLLYQLPLKKGLKNEILKYYEQ